VEGKGRSVEGSARDAIENLLAYRRDFDVALAPSAEPYGLGLVWGAELEGGSAEIVLATPDRLTATLEPFLS
jgi:hypothetical protein